MRAKSTDLKQAIPPIKRARGYRLYDFRGRRYLDLYQQNGYALLGHRPTGLTRILKQVCSKGLLADLPSVYEKRLQKALKQLLPGYKGMRIVHCLDRALELASIYLKREVTRAMIKDPLFAEHEGARADLAYWRPCLPALPGAEVVIPVLPFAVAAGPVAVCFKKELKEDFPAPAAISPLLLSGLIRAAYDLVHFRPAPWCSDELLKDAPGWRQQGIYVMAQMPENAYAAVFHAFLEQGYLLSPVYPGPSLLPGEAAEGELEKMLKLFREFPGE